MSVKNQSLIKGRDGIFYLKVPVPGRRRKEWCSTGERDRKRAQAVVDEFGADRIIHLAHARALTHETIAIATMGRRVTWTDVIKLWLEWMERRGSTRTAEVYLTHITAFVRMHGAENKPMTFTSEAQIHQFVNDGLCSMSTAVGRLSALRSIYRFACAKALTIGNPAELTEIAHRMLTVEQKETQHHEPLTEEQYQVLLANLPDPWRDWTVLGYCCGLRFGDAVGLQYASFTAEHIVVWPSKSKKAKRLALPLGDPLIARPELQELVARLLASRNAEQEDVWPAFALEYSTRARARYSQDYVRKIQRLGIVDRSFHSLRVSFARRLEAAGKTVYDIARVMAHTNTSTTEIYLGRG